MLVFYVPMNSFYDFIAHILPAFSRGRDFKRELQLVICSVVVLGVAIFGLIVGLQLWMIRVGAVKLAKVWLLTFLFAHFAYFISWLALFPSAPTEKLAQMGWHQVVGPLGPFFLWNVYLEHSKRVRDTYPFG